MDSIVRGPFTSMRSKRLALSSSDIIITPIKSHPNTASKLHTSSCKITSEFAFAREYFDCDKLTLKEPITVATLQKTTVRVPLSCG